MTSQRQHDGSTRGNQPAVDCVFSASDFAFEFFQHAAEDLDDLLALRLALVELQDQLELFAWRHITERAVSGLAVGIALLARLIAVQSFFGKRRTTSRILASV